MREIIQLGIVRQILTEYADDIPVHFFLKDFYKKHKQFGSRDRRFYSDIIYKYFRCKTLFSKLPFEEKLYYSGFLTASSPHEFYNYLQRSQNISSLLSENWEIAQAEKLSLLLENGIISWENYFPAQHKIDPQINIETFLLSHLSKPDFFIRVTEKNRDAALVKLKEQDIKFKQWNECLAFSEQIDMGKYLPENYFEVQDLSSQQTISLFDLKGDEKVWDCCSGAGGKSLMLKEKYPDVKLFCSDKRATVLSNLKKRFDSKQIACQGIVVYDIVKSRSGLSFNDTDIPENYFDLILADVPCSGSGTWGRNPERLYQFREEEVAVYSSIQRSIIDNAVKYLIPGGQLIYITCSVYADENSLNVKYFEKFGLELVNENYFIGYDKHADTMYGAVLRKVIKT